MGKEHTAAGLGACVWVAVVLVWVPTWPTSTSESVLMNKVHRLIWGHVDTWWLVLFWVAALTSVLLLNGAHRLVWGHVRGVAAVVLRALTSVGVLSNGVHMLVLGACGQVAADILRVAAPTSVSVLMNGPTSWCGGMCVSGACFVAGFKACACAVKGSAQAGGNVGGSNKREHAGVNAAHGLVWRHVRGWRPFCCGQQVLQACAC